MFCQALVRTVQRYILFPNIFFVESGRYGVLGEIILPHQVPNMVIGFAGHIADFDDCVKFKLFFQPIRFDFWFPEHIRIK